MITQASFVQRKADSETKVLALRDMLLGLPERQQDYMIDTAMTAIFAEDHRTKRLTIARTFNRVYASIHPNTHSSLDCAKAAVLCALHNKVHSLCKYSSEELFAAIEYCWLTWESQSIAAAELPTLHSIQDQTNAAAIALAKLESFV